MGALRGACSTVQRPSSPHAAVDFRPGGHHPVTTVEPTDNDGVEDNYGETLFFSLFGH